MNLKKEIAVPDFTQAAAVFFDNARCLVVRALWERTKFLRCVVASFGRSSSVAYVGRFSSFIHQIGLTLKRVR